MKQIFLQKWRKRSGFSQLQLGEKMEVDSTTISRWERGTVALTSKQIIKLAEIFNIKPSQLYAEPEDAEVVEKMEKAYKIIKSLDPESLQHWLEIGQRLAPDAKRK